MRKRPKIDRLTLASIVLAGVAAVLTVGLVQSDTQVHVTHCLVDIKPTKSFIAGIKKAASRRLVCSERVIALKDDAVLPHTSDDLLVPNKELACSFDVVLNPFGLLKEQVVTESIACNSDAETG